MSAFVVSTEHIDALLAAGLAPGKYGGCSLSWFHDGEHHELTHATADAVGTMILSENVRSVEHRYSPPGREAIYGEGFESAPDFTLPGTYREESPAPGIAPVSFPEWLTPYTYTAPKRPLAPVAVLKAISCFEYQSCEHDEWRGSEAHAFCEALRGRMIGQLPGYDDAPWSI